MRLGKGGVTRSKNQIAGNTASAKRIHGAPKLIFASQSIRRFR